MTISVIRKLRLINQQIALQKYKTPGEVVSWLGAVQAQDYLGSLWALGLRLPEATEKDIENALVEGKVVRTWPMRGTLHFVSPSDIRWMLKLLTPRVIKGAKSRYKQLELDETIFVKCSEILTNALKGGKQLTRPEFYKLLAHSNILTHNSRGLHILGHLAMKGVICFGPRKEKKQTIVLLDEWIPKSKDFESEEALAEITKRYFTSHGPASLQDFIWWAGLTVAEAKRGLEIVKKDFKNEFIEGRQYWFSKNIEIPKVLKNAAFLLPAFDEYLVSYKYRDAALNPINTKKVNAGGGILNPAIIINGQVVGTWKRTLKKQEAIVQKYTFGKFTETENQLLGEATVQYNKFLGFKI
jgi:hypothetical protein